MNDKHYLIRIAGFCAEEESYEEGCTGVVYDDTWDGESEFYASSKKEIIEHLSVLLGIEEEHLEINKMDNDYDNMFYVTYSMNKAYDTPSKEEVELWKKDEMTLYLADFYFFVFEVKNVENLSDII